MADFLLAFQFTPIDSDRALVVVAFVILFLVCAGVSLYGMRMMERQQRRDITINQTQQNQNSNDEQGTDSDD